jgi:hypothetical protein
MNKTMTTMMILQLMAVVVLPLVTNVVVVVLPPVVPPLPLQTLVALHPLTLPTRSSLLHSTSLLGVNPRVLNRLILLISNRQTLRLLWVRLPLLNNNTNKSHPPLHPSILQHLIIILVSSSNNIINNTTICIVLI